MLGTSSWDLKLMGRPFGYWPKKMKPHSPSTTKIEFWLRVMWGTALWGVVVILVISVQWNMESFEIDFLIEVVSSFEVHMWVWLASSNDIFDCEWEMCVCVNLELLNLRNRVATSKAWRQKSQNINFVAIFCHEVAGSLFNARLVQLVFLFLTPSFQASDLRCQTFLGDWWSFRMPDNCSRFVSQNPACSCHGVIFATFFFCKCRVFRWCISGGLPIQVGRKAKWIEMAKSRGLSFERMDTVSNCAETKSGELLPSSWYAVHARNFTF